MGRLIALLAFLLATPSFAAEWKIAQETNTVTWTAVGFPGFLRINGTGGKVQGEIKEAQGLVAGKVWVDLTKYKTGLELRDSHMHEKYMDTKKYPKALLEFSGVKAQPGNQDFKGTLTIKDTTKPVAGKLEILQAAKGALNVKSVFVVKITDYPSIGVPEYLGITVAEKVDVVVDFIANRVQ